MADIRVERVADVVVGYSTEVRAGDKVVISAPYVAEPLVLAVYRRCLERGAYPMIRTTLPRALPEFYRLASDDQLEFVWDTERWLVENADVAISIIADSNTRQLSKADPARIAAAARARKFLADIWMKRAAEGAYRWNVTLFPTEAHAMDAEMSLAEYEDFYYGACLVGDPDPVQRWRAIAGRNDDLVRWIDGRSEVHIEGDGTDLLLDVSGRTWIPASGKENFPDGEIFTGPVEDGTNGHVTFDFPAIHGGQAVEGIRLEFEGGRVVRASARRNEEFLIKTLDTDPGARILGEIGIGTNYGITGFTGEALLDEKIGGTVHLAVGDAYPETGGLNDSAVHWDMVCDLRRGGRITVDGELLLEDGKLVV